VPGFGAMQALSILKSRNIDIPFIIISGTVDEEIAVSAMKAGANNYIMKDRLVRLLPTIERELKDLDDRRERKRAQEEANLTNAKLTTIVEMLPDLFFIKGLDGKYEMVNSAFEAYVGRAREHITGRTNHAFFSQGTAAALSSADQEVLGQMKTVRHDLRMEKSGGGARWFDTIKVPLLDGDGNVIGIVGTSRDVTEMKMIEEELSNKVLELQNAWEQTVRVLSDAVEIKDAYTSGHQKRVAALSAAIGQSLGMSVSDITGLKMAALIHDVGKLQIPGEILSKPAKLMDAEFALVKTHSEAGRSILKDADFPWDIAQMVYQHHERLDGSGYPRGLVGSEIMLEARIIAVADVVEAMSSHRPYRPALGIGAALEEITQNSGRLYDPAVVEACVNLFTKERFTFDLIK
jgi:PAS domain S-box-containing protein